jgi:hypothetical protein
MLTTILTDRTTHEVECLAAEIFSTTYNLSWRDAVTEAVNCFRDLAAYAVDWDEMADAASENEHCDMRVAA